MTTTKTGYRVYLAARYKRVAEMRGVRDVLEGFGHEVTSRWIDDADVYDAERLESDPSGCAAFAARALADLCAADTLISFTGDGGKGGRHAEFGVAVALGKHLVVVGPREHVFHALAEVEWYPDRTRLAEALEDAAYVREHGGDDLDTGHTRDPEGDEAAHA